MIHPFSKRLSDGKIRYKAHFGKHEPPDESQSDEQPNKVNVQRSWFSKRLEYAAGYTVQQDVFVFKVKSLICL